MKKIILTEEQSKVVFEGLDLEHTPNVKHKRYAYKPENVLKVKKFLDTNCIPADYEHIGNDGMPCTIKIVSLIGPSGNALQNLDQEHLLELLIARHKDMFGDMDEARAFLQSVMNHWFNKKIGIFGTLSKNYVELNEGLSYEEITERANEADTDPTEKQKEAGNYKMGHVSIKGFQISIENPKGSYRKYKNEDGTVGKNLMKSHYGYFIDSVGKDGDAVDVFIGPKADDFSVVYAVDQNGKDGEFDETKVMFGFTSKEAAKKGYMENYSPDWKGFRAITAVSVPVFKKWLYRDRKQRKPFSEYVAIQKKKLTDPK